MIPPRSIPAGASYTLPEKATVVGFSCTVQGSGSDATLSLNGVTIGSVPAGSTQDFHASQQLPGFKAATGDVLAAAGAAMFVYFG